jgi:hypothetical protein
VGNAVELCKVLATPDAAAELQEVAVAAEATGLVEKAVTALGELFQGLFA